MRLLLAIFLRNLDEQIPEVQWIFLLKRFREEWNRNGQIAVQAPLPFRQREPYRSLNNEPQLLYFHNDSPFKEAGAHLFYSTYERHVKILGDSIG